MALAILARPSIAIRLRRIAADVVDAYPTENLQDLEAKICGLPIDVVIIDPAADGTTRLEETSELLRKYPSLYFMLYMPFRPTSMRTVLDLSRAGVRDVLTEGVDDSPQALRIKLERLACTALTRTNISTFLPQLADTTPDLANSIERMFEHPECYRSSADLAREAGLPLSRLYRRLELARLSSPRHFLIAAKVWHGYSYLKQSGHSVRDVANRLGYSQTRIFVSHVTMVFGVSPSVLRAKLPLWSAHRCLGLWLADGNRAGSTKPTLR